MANICITNYVIEGEKKELDALYETMKKLQGQNLGQLVESMENGLTWNAKVTPCM